MDFLDVIKFAAALGLVLSMIGGLAFAANRLNLLSNIALRKKDARLRIQESLTLDAKHRLMIVTNGDREHVLLLGPAGDLVVESRQRTPSDTANPNETSQIVVPLLKESIT